MTSVQISGQNRTFSDTSGQNRTFSDKIGHGGKVQGKTIVEFFVLGDCVVHDIFGRGILWFAGV